MRKYTSWDMIRFLKFFLRTENEDKSMLDLLQAYDKMFPEETLYEQMLKMPTPLDMQDFIDAIENNNTFDPLDPKPEQRSDKEI